MYSKICIRLYKVKEHILLTWSCLSCLHEQVMMLPIKSQSHSRQGPKKTKIKTKNIYSLHNCTKTAHYYSNSDVPQGD